MVKHLGRKVHIVHAIAPTEEDKVLVQQTELDGSQKVVKHSELELTEDEAKKWFEDLHKKLKDKETAWFANFKAKIAADKKAIEDKKQAAIDAKKPIVAVEQKPTQAL